MTTGWVHGPTERTVNWTSAKIPLIVSSPQAHTLIGGSQCCLGFCGISINSEAISNRLQKLIAFFPQYTVLIMKGHGSFWGWTRGSVTVKLWSILWCPSSQEPGHPFIQGILSLQTRSSLEINSWAKTPFCHNPMEPFFYLFENVFSTYTNQTKIQKASYLFYAWKHHDCLASNNSPYDSCHHKKSIAYFRSDCYGHCFVCDVH